MEEIRRLVDSLSPRTSHQYRSYIKRYVEWLISKGLLETQDTASDESQTLDVIRYSELPISTQLVHWHLIDTFSTGEGSLASVRKCISSLKFLDKLCSIHRGSSTVLDEKYLENVTRVQEVRETEKVQEERIQLAKVVSVNLWDPNAQLPEKYFRNGLEQLRFLVDFQWRLYTNMSYMQRSRIRFAELEGHANGGICIDLQTWSQLGEYITGVPPKLKTHQPISVVPHRNPVLCPIVSLAAYFYLRFHDGGAGFPELETPNGSWQEMPIVRGKSAGDYPREETLGNYYAAVFRYCRLNYKRREWFGSSKLEYPSWRPEEYEFFEKYGEQCGEAFPQKVPRDFVECFNLGDDLDVELSGVAKRRDLLVQIFPEIESYRRRGGLGEEANGFIRLIEVLRLHLLRGLPVLYQLFPDHDLFKTDTLSKADFKSFYGEVKTDDDFGMGGLVVGEDGGKRAGEGTGDGDSTPIPGVPGDVSQLVQFQTVSNFEILLSLLSQIFDRLEMKKSSREFAIHQLALVQDTLRDRIRSFRPGDEKVWGKEEDEDDGGGDGEEEEEEELKNMVEQLVDIQIKNHTKALEDKLDKVIDQKIDSRLERLLGKRSTEDSEADTNKRPKRDSEDATVKFKLDPDIDSVEAVILEWFTPNPLMGDECVHSMNKGDKSWRNGFESLYKERKAIVEFYVHLVNHRGMDRYRAVDICERLRGGGDLTDLAQLIKDWKHENGTFDGLGDL